MNAISTELQKPTTIAKFADALPRGIDPKRFARTALTEVNANPDLAACDPVSFFGALVQVAQMGLEVGKTLGQAYLIPFRNNSKGTRDVQLIVGFRGYIALALRSGSVRNLTAHCVFDGDDFDYALGTDQYVRHKPCGETRAIAVTHVYAVANLTNGTQIIEVMRRAEVDAIRDRGRKNPVWNTDFTEMARKTVVRRISKYLPLTPEVADALAIATALEKDDEMLPSRHDPKKIMAVMDEASDVDNAAYAAKRAETERTIEGDEWGLDDEPVIDK